MRTFIQKDGSVVAVFSDHSFTKDIEEEMLEWRKITKVKGARDGKHTREISGNLQGGQKLSGSERVA